jgi:hypothetical protein
MSELRFASENEAMQYLSDVTGKQVRVAGLRDDLSKELYKKEGADIEKVESLLKEHKGEIKWFHISLAIHTEDLNILKLLLDKNPKLGDKKEIWIGAIDSKKPEKMVKMLLDADAIPGSNALANANAKKPKNEDIIEMIEKGIEKKGGLSLLDKVKQFI